MIFMMFYWRLIWEQLDNKASRDILINRQKQELERILLFFRDLNTFGSQTTRQIGEMCIREIFFRISCYVP